MERLLEERSITIHGDEEPAAQEPYENSLTCEEFGALELRSVS